MTQRLDRRRQRICKVFVFAASEVVALHNHAAAKPFLIAVTRNELPARAGVEQATCTIVTAIRERRFKLFYIEHNVLITNSPTASRLVFCGLSPMEHPVEPRIAYFSMEIALDPAIPTYSGGLGVLAGDFLRSSADAELPMVAVTLAYRQGYFRQSLDAKGVQRAANDPWTPSSRCTPVDANITITLFGRPIQIRAWRYDVEGVTGGKLHVYLLDTDVPENDPDDRTLTDQLYGGDARYRLAQEAVLGLGGVRLLEALGYEAIDSYHLNEGHAALLIVGLLEKELRERDADLADAQLSDLAKVRECCVFTTHTPVPAGHDRFMVDLMHAVLGERRSQLITSIDGLHEGQLNMTYLALRGSRYINGVAMRHGEVSQDMFPHYPIHAITNGVHTATWTSRVFADLFDRQISAVAARQLLSPLRDRYSAR